MEKVTHQLWRRELIDAVVIGEACGVLQHVDTLHTHPTAITAADTSLKDSNQNQATADPPPQHLLTWTRWTTPLHSPAGKL